MTEIVGTDTWNSLPENIKSIDSIYKLKTFLKDHMSVNVIFGKVNYVISLIRSFSLTIFLKILNICFYCLIIHRYFRRIHTQRGNERDLGLDLFSRDSLFHFVFLYFIDLNPKKNKGIIKLSLLFIGRNPAYILSFTRALASQFHFRRFYKTVSVHIVT